MSDPQLQMRRANLDSLPALAIPNGFTMRTYQSGDGLLWEDLTEKTLGFRLNFEKDIKGSPFFRPARARVFYVPQ